MLGYITMGSNDLPRARVFYDALLEVVGAKRVMEFGEDMGGFTLWATSMEHCGLAVTTPYNRQPAEVGNGHMAALVLQERAQVDALHAKALELGGTCEGPPGVRGDEGAQAFYGAYFRDLDGNKLAAFRIGAA